MKCSIIFLLLLPATTFAFPTTNTASAKKQNNVVSIGEAIQQPDATLEYLLGTASRLWLPTDDNLAPHLQSQRVHHEKRQRWGSQLLERIGTVYDDSESIVFEDDRLSRAIRASAIPFEEDRPDKEGRHIRQALMGIHTLLGKVVENNGGQKEKVDHKTNDDIFHLIHRAEAMAPKLPLSQVVELRFATRGIIRRLSLSNENNCITPNMDERVAKLPFDIVPLGVNWNTIVSDNNSKNNNKNNAVVDELIESIPFRLDTITTRTGSVVTERRATAWVAESGIGALAYSGKLMTPQNIPPVVTSAMQQVESIMSLPPSFFDCALCNHYPTSDAACKFHTDPEHGTYWNRLTCVVAAGDCRRFVFRPIGKKKKMEQL